MSPTRLLAFGLPFLAGLALTACGGSGGGSGGTAITLPLTVATGAPVEGASVQVIDGAGATESCSGTTDAQGVINCQLSSATTAPFLVKAERSGAALYAVIPSAEVARANITPISSAMARKFAADTGSTVESLVANPASMAGTSSAQAEAAVNIINSIVKIVAQQTAGITVTNALTQAYTANTTDNLDKLIHSIRFGGDNSTLTISIPTATGTVAISVAFNASASTAETSVTNSTSNVTADLTDGDRITQTLTTFISLVGSCNVNDQAAMVNLYDAYSYAGGVKLDSGRTVAGWVQKFCEQNIGSLSPKMVETVARFDNFAIVRAVVENSSKQSITVFVGMKKVGNDWKLVSDNLPFNSSWKTRHALSTEVQSNGTKKVQYERYLDMWNDDKAESNYDALLPTKIEVYAIALKDMNGYSTGNWTTLMASAPKMTFLKDLNCGTRSYRLENSSNCSLFIADSTIPDIFNLLKANDFTIAVARLLDSNGNCMNCNSDVAKGNFPESALPLGKAYDFSEIFGATVNETSLKSGVELSSLSSAFWTQVKKHYATPSASAVNTFLSRIGSASIGSSIEVTWDAASLAPNRQIEGVWGGIVECGIGSDWTEFNEPNASLDLTENKWTFRHPSDGGELANSSYLSFTIATRFTESEFAFYMNAPRQCRS